MRGHAHASHRRVGLLSAPLIPALWGFLFSRKVVAVRKTFPLQLARDVVAVARRGQAPISRIAKDFGILESCPQRWLKMADDEDGVNPV